MAIKVKAIERKLKFEKGEDAPFEYRYVMQADLYNKLSQTKVIQEASLRSGIPKGSINAAWDAIGEVIKVGTGLITSRRVIFTPSVDIKNELKATSISITCIDRDGNIVKRVTSTDDAEVEDPENENPDGGPSTGSGQAQDQNQTPSNQSRQYTLTVNSADTNMGTVTGGGTYTEGSKVNISASAKAGYAFEKWNDGVTTASRQVTVSQNMSLTASFKEASQGGEDDTVGEY